ncbi:hypothetical protein SETIT_5G241300v2 [Setaria italica]|uniref:Receptor-like serine/threonine-protein kinase n=1 Tax=Setaria italica TaxID=4555 RepID=A0A368R8H3_SETIT|nr:hypothetical protein SETIT_5G241300v2 [Setaria italica]
MATAEQLSLRVFLPCFLLVAICVRPPLSRAAARASDTVSRDQPLSGGHRLVSKGGKFAVGFFQPDDTAPDRWYLAIWYNKISKHTPVWIANRARPISNLDSSELTISQDGNMALLDRLQSTIWATNITSNTSVSNSTVGIILDTGNFVLVPSSNTTDFLWQSFNEPTNVWLPGAKFGRNKVTGHTTRIVSWDSSVDPSPGYYTLLIDPDGSNQFIHQWNDSEIYWATGNWTGSMFTGMPEMASYPKALLKYEFVDNDQESYFIYHINETILTAMFLMEVSGQVKGVAWLESAQDWVPFFAVPKAQCSVYFVCGSFAMCTENTFTFCSCLRGFNKQYEGNWLYGNPRGGCTRKAKLQCGANSSRNTEIDGFYTLSIANLPDKASTSSIVAASADACKQACLNNCSCVAYFYDDSCSLWYGDLINLVSPDGSTGHVIYVRLAASEFFSGSTKTGKPLAVWALTGGAILIAIIVIAGVLLVPMKKIYNKRNKIEGCLVVFSFRYLRTVTKNFSEILGRGSFGSVYKGILPDGTLVAVKKLDGLSQGEKPFRAEVSTIGTIQHVNLIRLLGFCTEQSMKMLVYEYMPNGSLDRNIFASTPVELSWNVRFQIALGVAKGLSYLHEGCRSCIIHCDIKPENVLLDASFKPKIAVFGLAKLVGRDFSRVLTTMRGTVGYLAPEWISGTAITPKADVFSYGMLLFEIMSGKRNSAWHQQNMKFFPVLVATRLQEGGDIKALFDSEIMQDANLHEVGRACKVACWWIQDDENTRPAMREIV